MATTKLTQKPLPVNVMVALYDFQARDPDEITIKEKQLLYLVEEKGKSDEWARVRLTVDGSKGEGLVPWTYIAPKKPLYRANALYRFTRQKIDEVDMALGQNVSVYGSLDAFYLVKVDSSASRQAAVGFIPGNYIEEWPTGEREELGPRMRKTLPAEYCALCEGAYPNSIRYECTQCSLPNGSKYFVCQTCADDRQACLVHQIIKGQTHLFTRHLPPETRWICSQCNGSTAGAKSFFCVSCPNPTTVGFELCLRCYSDPNTPRHQHPLITITPEGLLTQTHVVTLAGQPPSYQRYICDGCRRVTSRFVLNCKKCPLPGYDLCPECAEFDRATYWHDRWTGGMPHEFEVIDMSLKSS